MTDAEPAPALGLVLECLPPEQASLTQQELEADPGTASLMLVCVAARDALRPDDNERPRLVVTGDLVQSVHDREERDGKPFTVERGAGIVAAKAMAPNADGVVDILVPLYMLGPV